MKDRIKKLRKQLGMTQAAFGETIEAAPNTVACYESGVREPSNKVISLICVKHRVNETWLRTGKGEMFQPEPEDEVSRILERFGLGAEFRVPLMKISQLGEDEQEYLVKAIENFLEYHRKARHAERRSYLIKELDHQLEAEEKGEDASSASSAGELRKEG